MNLCPLDFSSLIPCSLFLPLLSHLILKPLVIISFFNLPASSSFSVCNSKFSLPHSSPTSVSSRSMRSHWNVPSFSESIFCYFIDVSLCLPSGALQLATIAFQIQLRVLCFFARRFQVWYQSYLGDASVWSWARAKCYYNHDKLAIYLSYCRALEIERKMQEIWQREG